MDSRQSDRRPPFEIGALALILLSFNGQFVAAIAVCILWIVLSRLWPNAAPKVLMVAGVQLGLTTAALMTTANGPVDFVSLAEVLVLAAVCLLLVATSKPVWAYLFLIHSVGFFTFHASRLLDASLNADAQRTVICVFVLRAILTWQIFSYVWRRPHGLPESQPTQPTDTRDENAA